MKLVDLPLAPSGLSKLGLACFLPAEPPGHEGKPQSPPGCQRAPYVRELFEKSRGVVEIVETSDRSVAAENNCSPGDHVPTTGPRGGI